MNTHFTATCRIALAAMFCLAIGAGILAAPARAAERGQLAQANGDVIAMPDGDRSAIRGVIEQQLQAFLRDDGSAAFSYATPEIQGIFQTPENFMAMVRGGYQPVYRPQAVTFKDIINLNGAPAQRVLVVGPDGVPVMAVYPMQQMPDGHWLINGCFLLGLAGSDA